MQKYKDEHHEQDQPMMSPKAMAKEIANSVSIQKIKHEVNYQIESLENEPYNQIEKAHGEIRSKVKKLRREGQQYQAVADRFIGYQELIAKASSSGAVKKNVNFVEGRKLNFNIRPEHERKSALGAQTTDLSEHSRSY